MAGDIALGEEFLDRLQPYIWRKYLDFALHRRCAIPDPANSCGEGPAEIAVEGHNLKSWPGGIREIEFFVQTQQLIAGGRNRKLRARSTLAMLDELAEAH
ncbi:MAG: hypothetical protein U1E15_10815 [Hyphomicrobiales bacterium]